MIFKIERASAYTNEQPHPKAYLGGTFDEKFQTYDQKKHTPNDYTINKINLWLINIEEPLWGNIRELIDKDNNWNSILINKFKPRHYFDIPDENGLYMEDKMAELFDGYVITIHDSYIE